MGHELRKYMADVDGDPGLDGHVEVDETIVGGRVRGIKNRGRARVKGKSTVFGMVERGGDVITRVVPDAKKATLSPIITENVQQGSTISSDEWAAYKQLDKAGYNHGTCDHGNEEWVNGIHHTNSIEGFWSRLKNSIKGTYIHVSPKHLSKYLGEFEYRYNMRKQPKRMFDRLLQAF
jgi:transposase-like protein